jgi:hypothetical protein
MRAEVFIDQPEGGVAEISVVKHGLSSGAARGELVSFLVGRVIVSVTSPTASIPINV